MCAVLVLSLAAAAAAPGMDECSAEVSVTLDRQDGSELQFSVDEAVIGDCNPERLRHGNASGSTNAYLLAA